MRALLLSIAMLGCSAFVAAAPVQLDSTEPDASTGRRRPVVYRPPLCEAGRVVMAQGAAGLAVDGTHLYFGTYGGEVARVRKDGGSAERLASVAGSMILEVAIDEANVYFVSRPVPGGSAPDSIFAVPRAGGAAIRLADHLSYVNEIVADGEWLYVVVTGTQYAQGFWNQDGSIMRLRKDGSAAETLASPLRVPYDIWLDDEHLYFVENGLGPSDRSGGVRRMSRSGGTVERVVNVPFAWALTGDDTNLYVFGRLNYPLGEVSSVSKSDGRITPLVSGIETHIVQPLEFLDGTLYYLHFADLNARLMAYRLSDAGLQTLAEFEWGFLRIAVDPCAAYFTTPSEIRKVRR